MPRPVVAKTQAMRVLEARGLSYEALTLPTREPLPAAQVARTVGLEPGQTFKTLVVVSGRTAAKPNLVLVPGDSELDLKKLAAVAGEKRLRLAALREAECLTGLQRGGISPLSLLERRWPIYIDETATLFDRIWVSAGKVGVGLIVRTDDLLGVLDAHLVDIAAST